MEEERARFCDSCNAVIGWFATYCDDCGMRVGEGGGSPAEAPVQPGVKETASVEQDLYRAHLRLVHKSRESSEKLKKDCRRVAHALKEVEARPNAPESIRKVMGLSERLIDLSEEWEELQHGYNRQSESIEEEFLSRIDELEADLELVPHHQEAIEEEVTRFLESLEEGAEELRETGRFLEIVRARQNSGVLAFGGSERATALVGIAAFLLGLSGAAYGLFMAELAPEVVAACVGPPFLGLIALFLHARARPS